MRKFRDELSVIRVWDTSSILRTHSGQLTVIPNTSSSSRLSGSLSYNKFITCFHEFWIYKTWSFFHKFCCWPWSVLNVFSFKIIRCKLSFLTHITHSWALAGPNCIIQRLCSSPMVSMLLYTVFPHIHYQN